MSRPDVRRDAVRNAIAAAQRDVESAREAAGRALRDLRTARKGLAYLMQLERRLERDASTEPTP